MSASFRCQSGLFATATFVEKPAHGQQRGQFLSQFLLRFLFAEEKDKLRIALFHLLFRVNFGQ